MIMKQLTSFSSSFHLLGIILVLLLTFVDDFNSNKHRLLPRSILVNGHIVLTKDDNGQSLVLTGEDGKGGKGGKGGGDQLVIAGNNMGGGQGSNMIMQDAGNRAGDVVINGNSMIVPGEDGHIVLADSRSRQNNYRSPNYPPVNFLSFWLPYMDNRAAYNMMPFFGGQFG